MAHWGNNCPLGTTEPVLLALGTVLTNVVIAAVAARSQDMLLMSVMLLLEEAGGNSRRLNGDVIPTTIFNLFSGFVVVHQINLPYAVSNWPVSRTDLT